VIIRKIVESQIAFPKRNLPKNIERVAPIINDNIILK